MSADTTRLPAEYVVPLRWHDDTELTDLTGYLRGLVAWMDVTVVDGSEPEIYARHAEEWSGWLRHLAPEPWPGGNGKVAGVMTGIRCSRHEQVVIADDDVRWERASLERALELLTEADLVRPQNYFAELPWHARHDSARSLLNRAFGADYPGTFALRRSCLMAAGGYDGDVLFENLELSRTVRAAGGRELLADDLVVARRPPSLRHFWGQRVRQAYDDLAQPARLVAEAAILPACLVAVLRHRGRVVLTALAVLAVAAAEYGRRRAGGRSAFPPTAAAWAPLWVTERAVCVWIALGFRVAGGMPYAGRRLRVAAHSVRRLRRARRAAGG